MADEPTDVDADSSTAPDPAPDPEPTPDPVPDSDAVGGRTLENVRAEFARKHNDIQQTLQQLLAVMSAQPSRQEPVAQRGWDQYDDAQLAQLAQSGSTDAHLALTQRISAREHEQRSTVERQAQTVRTQLAALYSKYQMLTDASHPLTQAAMRAKLVLQQSGEPNTQATDVKAIMIAIADNPHLAIQQPAATRRVDPGPQAGVDGATTRRSPNRPAATKIDPKIAALAQRMGIDPVKAMERFQKRQTEGQSAVSPQVALIVREQGGA